ncbi:MAG: DUF721 domain-containing protein [Marinilabiliaceae bacterium]
MPLDTSKKLSEVVLEVLKENGASKQMLEHRAQTLWHTVMGPTVNRATSSVRVRDGVMYVGLSSSVVRNELFHLKGRIIAAINKALGQDVITDIRFQ